MWVDRGGVTAQHTPQVANRLKASVTAARVPVFPIACWVLGLMAFGQLLVAGLALGARLEASRQVRVVEREVTKVVAVPAAPRAGRGARCRGDPPAGAGGRPPERRLIESAACPAVADAAGGGSGHRTIGDGGEDRRGWPRTWGWPFSSWRRPKGRSPGDPVVLFELGLTHEAMGVFDTASDYFAEGGATGCQPRRAPCMSSERRSCGTDSRRRPRPAS